MKNETCPTCGEGVVLETVNNSSRVRCSKSYQCGTKTPWLPPGEAVAMWEKMCESANNEDEPIVLPELETNE